MMNFRSSFVISIALLITAGVVVNADTLNGSGSWQSWSAATTLGPPNNPTYGGPFWNNKSGTEGPAGNVGWCLAGGGTCSLPNPPGALPFFGSGNSALPTMSFSSGGSGVDVSLAGVFTTQTTPALGIDYFGYYLLDSSGKVTSPTRLFSAADTPGKAASFSVGPNTDYGFYLENVQGQGTPVETDYWFYMDSTQDITNGGTTPFQHVAVFQNGATDYYLGFEDCITEANNSCDRDYNDMIVKMSVSATAVPEPASGIFVCAGLLSMGLFLARKKFEHK